MRFVVTGEWTRNNLLKIIIIFFLIYITAFSVTNLLLFVHKMGFSYEGVVQYYRGAEERYLQPRSYQGLLEVSHMHLFSMGVLMLTLTHLILFAPLKISMKVVFILAAFGSALCEEASNWLIRFVHPYFAYLKLISFVLLELSLFSIIGVVFWVLITSMPSAYSNDRNGRNQKGEAS